MACYERDPDAAHASVMSLPCRARNTHHPTTPRVRLRRAHKHHDRPHEPQLDPTVDDPATSPLDIPTSFELLEVGASQGHCVITGRNPNEVNA